MGGGAATPVTTSNVNRTGTTASRCCPVGEACMSPAKERPLRIIVAKPGLDGHDRGAKIIARALRDAGIEVIYTGLHQTPEQVVEATIQEDADAIGISILSGAHMTLVPKVIELLQENDAEDVLVFVGGTIPKEDIPKLKEAGVGEVFTPGTPTKKAVEYLQQELVG